MASFRRTANDVQRLHPVARIVTFSTARISSVAEGMVGLAK